MKTGRLPLVLPFFLCLPVSMMAEEATLKSRIVFVGLFKNGLAVIKREAAVPGPGSYRFDEVPTPVHGTFWIESTAPIETAVKMREVEVPLTLGSSGNLQEELG